jgi:hypothetical protein
LSRRGRGGEDLAKGGKEKVKREVSRGMRGLGHRREYSRKGELVRGRGQGFEGGGGHVTRQKSLRLTDLAYVQYSALFLLVEIGSIL